MACGRPRKHTRNITGLRNQPTQSTVPQLPYAEPLANGTEPAQTLDDSHENSNPSAPDRPDTPEWELGLHFDSTRFIINDDDAGIESDLEVEEASLCRDWGDKNLQEGLIELAVNKGDDPLDEDWLPYALKKRKKPRIGESL